MVRMSGWIISSYSSSGSPACVEVRISEDIVSIRDSKNREGGMLHVDPSAWTRFVRLSTES